jgi:hydrogenase maturation protein HypF
MYGDSLFEQGDAAVLRAFSGSELTVLHRMLANAVNAPLTSSAGRLFDAVAAIVGLRPKASFEGQAAMELEFAAQGDRGIEFYPFVLDPPGDETGSEFTTVDWEPAIAALIRDMQNGTDAATVAARFHRGLAEMIVAVARRIGIPRVALSGGCFQNRFLTELTIRRLEAEGFRPYWHQRIPPNDGGIALGQIVAALRLRQGDE